VPDAVRLRRLLKALLRGFGLHCLDVRELPASEAGTDDKHAREGVQAPALPNQGRRRHI
jgi:hypothetical protein